jgi:steroid 5-alpha reductase family enzyme
MGSIEIYGWGFLGIWAMVTLLWLLSIPLRNVSIVDIFWGMGFVLTNLWYYIAGEGNPERKLLLLVLVSIWGLRLSIYLAWRNVGKGEDFRYEQFRKDYGPERYWWLSYFQVFLLQGLLMGLIAVPLAFGQGRTAVGTECIWDYVGAACLADRLCLRSGWRLAIGTI